MELETNIHDDSVREVKGIDSTSGVQQVKEDSPKVDSGLSSIEKSKAVIAMIIPLMNSPILTAPSSNQDYLTFAVTTKDASVKPMIEFLNKVEIKENEIKNEMVAGWLKNLEKIKEDVRQLLNSPIYQHLQEIRLKGDPHQGNVSGVQSSTSAQATAANPTAYAEPVSFLSALDRLQVLERVPPTVQVQDTTSSRPSNDSSSQVVVIPLVAAMIIGGGLALGSTEITTSLSGMSSNAMKNVVELVERIQPLFPSVSVQNIIPLINLMVIGPIYYNSWDEAVSNFKNHERHNYVQIAQNFARDVLKMIGDPNFILTLINRMEGSTALAGGDQDRLSRMLKIILLGTALGLLYSVEVGKVQQEKFGGMEPEELRDLLSGDLVAPVDSNKKPTVQQELTANLIKRTREQLSLLSPEDRLEIVSLLLDYLSKNRELDPMLDPAKIFEETLAAANYNPNEKADMLKA